METTPTRRSRDVGQGLTPSAKRIAQRVVVDEGAAPTTLTLEEVSKIMLNVRELYAKDMEWVQTIAIAVEDHASRLDYNRNLIK